MGEVENLVSCHGCGQSVHPSCRVYSTELVNYYEQHGWICDECKPCIVCDESPSESDKSEDLLVCEYCDQGIHYTCLHPRPDKRPKVRTRKTFLSPGTLLTKHFSSGLEL